MSILSNKTAMADVKFVRIIGGGVDHLLGVDFACTRGQMGDQKTGSYSGHPEFHSRSEEYPKVGLESFVPVFIHHKQ
jgi:hypothetical protein